MYPRKGMTLLILSTDFGRSSVFLTLHLLEKSYNFSFSMKEFQLTLSSCNDTAPGPEEIIYAIIRHVAEETSLYSILGIFNRL